MAFTSAPLTTEPYKFSIGPFNVEIQTFSMVSTDVSGTVTAQRLSRVDQALVVGLGTACQTAAPVITAGTQPSVALTFADPSAAVTGYVAKNINGYILLLGR